MDNAGEDTKLEKLLTKVEGFSKIFNDVIQDKSCTDANPFIENVSKYIGNYIPQFEYVFKYHLLVETILSILSVDGSPITPVIEIITAEPKGVYRNNNKTITLFNNSSSVSDDVQTQNTIVTYMVNILGNPSKYNTDKELTELYDTCFPGKMAGGKPTPLKMSKAALGSLKKIVNSNVPSSGIPEIPTAIPINTDTLDTSTPENTADPDKTCFINTKRDIKLQKTLMKDNVTKLNIKREVGPVITDAIDKLSHLVLSEKSFDRVLLKSKNPEDVSKIQMIKTVKNKLIHDYGFVIKKDDPKYGDIYSKSFTIQLLQNIKLFLINIAKSIVSLSKERSEVYGLHVLLITLLQDNGVKGFIRTIGRSEQYYQYTKELRYYTQIADYKPKLERNVIACLTYIFYKLTSNPKIKSTNGIDLKRTHVYMKELNNGLVQQLFKGGGLTDMTSAMSGISSIVTPDIANSVVKQPVSSYLDPQNRYVETVVKDYVGSVISSVKKKVYTYNVYESVKTRLKTDADELRTSILVCVLEMFNGKSFRVFLTKLLQENDIVNQDPGKTTRATFDADENQMVGNDIMLKLFLQKLTDELNNPANKFSEEVIGKYANLISEISESKDMEDEIAKALQANVKKTGGGRKWRYRSITFKPSGNRKTNTTSNHLLLNTISGRTSIRRSHKKRPIHRRNTIRNTRQFTYETPNVVFTSL